MTFVKKSPDRYVWLLSVNVSRAVGPRCVDRAINNLSNDYKRYKPYNLRPRTTFYLSWFSRYCGFMNCHVTPMRVFIGSESSRAIMINIDQYRSILIDIDQCRSILIRTRHYSCFETEPVTLVKKSLDRY